MGCKIIRRKLGTLGIMSFNGGPTKTTGQEWREEECGTPIFSKIGGNYKYGKSVCDSCANGWTHEHNFMLDIPSNHELLRAAGVILNSKTSTALNYETPNVNEPK